MKESKKVSDLLIDLKVPLPDKEQVYVLLSGRNIAWVAGIRIDNRYKITTATKRMFVCELKNKS
jgi:tRNA(Ile)-lysidine synthase